VPARRMTMNGKDDGMKRPGALAGLATIVLGITTCFHSHAAEPHRPFLPANARVWDADDTHSFVWRDRCGNNSQDHQLAGGFEWDRDSRGFLASGKGWVGEEYRDGLMMLAFPDGNVLSARWKVHCSIGKRFRVQYSLTNQAAAASTNGLKFTVTAADAEGNEKTILEHVLPRGDNRLHVKEFDPDFPVESLTFSHDNLGQECWDVLWFLPEITDTDGPQTTEITRLTPSAQPSPTPPLSPSVRPEALRLAICDLADTFGTRYPRSEEFLARLKKTEALPLESQAEQLAALQREALAANPLVSEQPLLFVTRHQYRSHYHAIDTLFHTNEFNPDRGIAHADLFQGGGAMKTLDLKTGEIKTLVDVPEGVARDPDIHFDGGRIVFAMRHGKDEDYQIYEIGTDGSGVKQLTRAAGVCDFDPIYLPDDTIVFSSTREPKYNMCSRDIAANLFRMERDGANIHQITKNTLFDNHAELLPDGRILYARWEYVDRNFGDAHGLWTVNPDGTNQAIYWGNNTAVPGAAFNAHIIPGTQQTLCVFGPHHDRLWGALAIVDRRRGIDGRPAVIRTWPKEVADWTRIGGPFDCDATTKLPVKYEDPWPLSDKYFLCSRMTGKGEQTGIYLVDVFGNEVLLHAEHPGCYDPMPLKARTRPPVIPARRDFEAGEGVLYVTDVYEGTHMEGVERGAVKWLRVVESPEKRHWSPGSWNGQGYTAPGMNWHSLENKRILGKVPVEEDGSAHFVVPADTFVYFQLLDENEMMVQSMRSGTVLQSGERTGCTGCHEGRRGAPPWIDRADPLALKRPPSRLESWYGPPRLFSFAAEVQPVFDKHCVECHDYGTPAGEKLNLASDRLIAFNTAYSDLWRRGFVKCAGGGPAEILDAYSWGSHASRLATEIRTPSIDDHKDIRLSKEETDRVMTWLDLNGVYYPTYACAYPDSLTGRCPLDSSQLGRLAKLTGLDLGRLRNHSGNPGPLVNFDRPEVSPCLTQFDDGNSPAYREALAIITEGKQMLAVRPRADMPGFQPCDTDCRREEKYATRRELEAANRDAIRAGVKVYD
jgi:hydrazine synthase alpha subunit-like protein